MTTGLKIVKIKASTPSREGTWLTLEPILRNNNGQVIYVAKNPADWLSNYSVWAREAKGKLGMLLVSQHKTKALAVTAAEQLRNKDVLHIHGWVYKRQHRR